MKKLHNIISAFVGAIMLATAFASVAGWGVNQVPQVAFTDSQGAGYINGEGLKATYSTASQVTAASSATDVVYITGSATKTIRITRVNIGGRATSAVSADISIIKRSTADTGGTCTANTIVPQDSTNAAATATVYTCTANPTLGTAVGAIKEKQLFLGNLTTGAPGEDVLFLEGDHPAQMWVLRGAAQTIGINLNGGTYSGNLLDYDIQWTEE